MAHHPPHIYLDDTWYIVTAATLYTRRYLSASRAKALVIDKLSELVTSYAVTLRAWVILDNHYHVLFKSRLGEDLPRFFGQLHGATSRQINLWDEAAGRQVWHNYWDTCIRSEEDFWIRFNYIHNNPIKHGYVKRLEDWPYSSYHHWLATKGSDWLDDCWARYPVIDFLEGDDFDLTGVREQESRL